jgi:hypothetical protein
MKVVSTMSAVAAGTVGGKKSRVVLGAAVTNVGVTGSVASIGRSPMGANPSGVLLGAGKGVAVGRAVAVWDGVGVNVRVAVGVRVGPIVGSGVTVGARVAVAVSVAVGVCV